MPPVIPAQAGIQVIENPRVAGQHQKYGFARCAELYGWLDSGLRRNDEMGELLCLK